MNAARALGPMGFARAQSAKDSSCGFLGFCPGSLAQVPGLLCLGTAKVLGSRNWGPALAFLLPWFV